MTDGVQEVGLAEAGVAVDEERVVGLGRCLGHGDRRGVGESVGSADDEVVEAVLRVEPRVRAIRWLSMLAVNSFGTSR